jgi:hypothetical protein
MLCRESPLLADGSACGLQHDNVGGGVMSTSELDLKKAAAIRELNDAFRTNLMGGKVMMTTSVAALPDRLKLAAVHHVRGFAKFNADNDPWHEHDFGSFELQGEKLFWKIDYYDKSTEHSSEDPADPAQTTRVLTIMLASEY